MSDEKKKLHPGAAKNLKYIGIGVGSAVVIVGGLMTMSLSGGKKGPATAVDVRAVGSSEGLAVERQDALTPGQIKALRATQEAEAASAARNGQFYIPGDQVARPVPVGGGEAQQPTPSAELRAMQASGTDGAVAANVPDPNEAEELARRREGLQRQLSGLIAGESAAVGVQRVNFSGAGAKQPVSGDSASESADASGATRVPLSAPESVEIAGAFQIVAAESASPIDTYKTNYASARIVAGPLAGALLFGKAEAADEGLVVTYTNMRFNGKAYTIEAWALDEATSTNAVSADIDRRYFERMVLPILLAGVQGYNQKVSETGSQVVVAANGTAVATPSASAKQARAAGVSKGLEIAQQEVQRSAAKPARFTMADRVPLGVMFRKPVLSTDVVK